MGIPFTNIKKLKKQYVNKLCTKTSSLDMYMLILNVMLAPRISKKINQDESTLCYLTLSFNRAQQALCYERTQTVTL